MSLVNDFAHSGYVWAAYGFFALIVGLDWAYGRWQQRRLLQRLRQRLV